MRFYVDFDDCLCESGRAFARLAHELFGKDVPYEEMRHFNLREAFDLTDEQYERLLIEGHEPDVLLSIEETSGASAFSVEDEQAAAEKQRSRASARDRIFFMGPPGMMR